MKRTSFRNLAILIFLVVSGIAFYLFWQSQQLETTIAAQRGTLTSLQQELDNANRLTAALSELDQLTLNENNATQLDILRHLGLEQARINFTQDGIIEKRIGDTSLYVHNIRIGVTLSYPALLNLVDRLHNSKRLILQEVNLDALPEASAETSAPDELQMSITGNIYGLKKTDQGLGGNP